MENSKLETQKQDEPAPTAFYLADDRSPCEDCWMGEYKETGYRYCNNTKCPLKPGAGN